RSRQQLSNPSALNRISHALAAAAFNIGADAPRKELFDDFALGADCHCSTAPATPGVLHGEMKRGGPRFVFRGRVTACLEETSHRGSASRADGAMQSGRAILVLGMKVGPMLQEAANGRHLPFGIPGGTDDVTVGGVV